MLDADFEVRTRRPRWPSTSIGGLEMKKVLLVNVIGFALLLMPAVAVAATISFSPSSQTVGLADSVFVDVSISGLAGGIVSAYDLDVTYDAAVLVASDVVFGSFLGDESFFEVFNGFDLSVAGVVDFAQLSLLSDPDLSLMQPDSFVLATIEFTAIGAGTSSLDYVTPLDITGFVGGPLHVYPQSGSVRVSNPIPEPSAALVFGVGTFIVGAATRSNKRAARALG
jgi:hypothetical protein